MAKKPAKVAVPADAVRVSFDDFITKCYPAHAMMTVDQRLQLRDAFYGGAAWIMGFLAGEDPDETEEQISARLRGVNDELDKFTDTIVARTAMRNTGRKH
jgi:hypothetical protein